MVSLTKIYIEKYGQQEWDCMVSLLDDAEKDNRYIMVEISPNKFAQIGIAHTNGELFNVDDPLHVLPSDVIRHAEMIRDARASKNYAEADRVKNMAIKYGFVNVKEDGTVVVVDNPHSYKNIEKINKEIGLAIQRHNGV